MEEITRKSLNQKLNTTESCTVVKEKYEQKYKSYKQNRRINTKNIKQKYQGKMQKEIC